METSSQRGEQNQHGFDHFSHDHPLYLITLYQKTTTTTICSGCNLAIAGKNHYTCNTCNYSLHELCYNMPRVIKHPSHPHNLKLVIASRFNCNACGSHGSSGLAYNCAPCQYHIHTLCSSTPLTKYHSSHNHSLSLIFSPPYENFRTFDCDVCGGSGSDHWLYRCHACNFDAHVGCPDGLRSPQLQSQHETNPWSYAAESNTSVTCVTRDLCGTNGNFSNSNQVYGNGGSNQPGGLPNQAGFGGYNQVGGYPNQAGFGGYNQVGGYPNQIGFDGYSQVGAYSNQTAFVGYNQVPGNRDQKGSVGYNQMGGYPNQNGSQFGRTALGAGVGGLVLTGFITGGAEGTAQSFVSGFGGDGSGSFF